ncbi:metallophosphoesterase family protein [Lysinibacter sp. HNR]|uniref:metallophosphoesterase family protein n=1 Tax=Lysinibacter sp. HNR TaxID=3031408 RepID=UPI002435F4E6|nr:metallophosphoesterase family protein [Lysinibacter sp. HNR]WGD38408.1 metallophosphoesterase family protein [Lysinibacter sp. HNR]
MSCLALISDIHGNTPALVAVLEAITRDGIEQIVNLGDIASCGVDPRGTLDVLRKRPDILTVRGNHERQFLTLSREYMGASDRLAFDLLTYDDRERPAGLPVTVEPAPGVLAFHGSPDDDLCYLLHTVDSAVPDSLREANDQEVLERLGASTDRFEVFVCGHTH